MKTSYIITIAFAAIMSLTFLTYMSSNNTAVSYETEIEAIHTNMSNIYGSYEKTLFEAVQVNNMAKDHVKEVLQAAIQGRYGSDGAKQLFLSIQESNPNVDPSLYQTLQNIIRAGNKDFSNEQTRMIDAIKEYKKSLKKVPFGWFMQIAGFPSIDFDDYKVVTTQATTESLETGIAKPLKFN